MPNIDTGYRIGDLAEAAAVSRDTLRYYERVGLLEHPPRTSGGFRIYSESTLDRLLFIRRAQAVGFTLDEVRDLVTFDGRGSTRCRRVRNLVAEKLVDLDQRLEELRTFRRTLARSLKECDTALNEQPNGECPVVEHGIPGARGPRPRALKEKQGHR